MEYRQHSDNRFIEHFISFPFIWAPLPFFILLDIVCEIYQAICFPLYRIEKVRRSDYILVRDRNRLKYLNFREKLGCMYCGYANGLMLYIKEIAGRTEKYWCGIMHQNKPEFKAAQYQKEKKFVPYNDKKKFLKTYPKKSLWKD